MFLGDRWTDPDLKNRPCTAVKKENGKCVRGRNANMLVEIYGVRHVVPGRRLRKWAEFTILKKEEIEKGRSKYYYY